MILNLLIEIKVNDLDKSRCDRRCSYIEKKQGNYKCTLFDDIDVDTGDDDDIGYGFKRCDKCLLLEYSPSKEHQKVAMLKEALEWYANKDHWICLKDGIYQTDKIWRLDRYGNMVPEQGKHAEQAIQKLKEME